MIPGKIPYTFRAKVWQYASTGGWFFVSLPIDMSNEIRTNLKSEEQGWGRMKAIATIGTSQWDTAIWFDTKLKTYLLPLKANVRAKENILTGTLIDVCIYL